MWSLQALKLGCLLALAALPLLCGLLPALLFRLRGSAANGAWGLLGTGRSRGPAGLAQRPSPRLSAGASRSGRSILSCAAGGVFMAACLLDVVPDSLADLRDELRRQRLSVPEGGGSPGGGPAKPHRAGGSGATRVGTPSRVWRWPLTPRGQAGNDLAAFDRVPEPLLSPKVTRPGSFGPTGRPR